MKAQDRKGLTLIDVIVVLVILMVMAALLLPATRSARPAARRSDCKNKLKQIGIALHNYHETYERLPPGWVAVRGPHSGEFEESAYGWGTYILLFMDQAPLYQQGLDFHAADPSFQTQALGEKKYASTALPAYRCPSDLGQPQDTTASIQPLGTTNYVANFGVGLPEREHDPTLMQGLFGQNSSVRIRDIKDGTANVVMVGERRMPRAGTSWMPGRVDGSFNSYWSGMPRGTSPLAIVATVTDGKLPRASSAEAEERNANLEADLLNFVGPLRGTQGPVPVLKVIKINKLSDGTALTDSSTSISGSYSSYHPGGFQALLGDGSVRFISDSVAVETYINLMRRADGTVLGEF